ncbi:aminotransferase class I/II-fold pyridoxal phosphate-dependent enzyme [Frankia nepalensis]|nr:pyridoxal phosphate-dependent aminotransferase family protein [Frankia nepalensis]
MVSVDAVGSVPTPAPFSARHRRLAPAFDHVLAQPPGGLAEMHRLRGRVPFWDPVIDEIDGRRIRVGDHWLIDFASCNYLGLDLEPEIMAAVPEYLARWGTHPSWCRLVGNPRLFTELEQALAELLGAEDTLLFPTVSHIHFSVLPALAGAGAVFVELRAHHTIHEGARMASTRGARVIRFREENLPGLARKLAASDRNPKVICVDGVNSMTGNGPPLAELTELARAYDALLYIDDAHGFGVLGERSADELSPYGSRGNGTVRHLGGDYDGLVLVGGLSKAYSSLLAFVACPPEIRHFLRIAAGPYTYSGPPPVASFATAQAGLRFNAIRGDVRRADLYRRTSRVLDGIHALGLETRNETGFPIIEVPLADPDLIEPLGTFLFNRGILATMVPYPIVPRRETGFRISVTAANTDAEIEELLRVIAAAADRFPLRRAADGPETGDG